MKHLTEKLKLLPKRPGVYLYKDKEGTIIYVGKAKNLFNRVHSYLSPSDTKTLMLTRKIADIEYFVTNNETEALLLENNLIKKHTPRYNIKLKDNKSYPLIKITTENLPRITKCREKNNRRDKYFGPFVNMEQVDMLLDFFKKVLKIRSCNKKFSPPYKNTPCLNYHIKLCNAPCAGYISEENYEMDIKRAAKILSGDYKAVKLELHSRMIDYAEKELFEQAAGIRDSIRILEQLEDKQYIFSHTQSENSDFIGIYSEKNISSIALIQLRGGLVTEKYNYLLKNVVTPETLLTDFLTSYYLDGGNLPSKIFIPGQNNEENENELIEDAIVQKYEKKVRFKLASTKKERTLAKLASENAEIFLQEKQYHLEKIHHLRELKRHLDLPVLPRIIECFDVATLDGKFNTAAMVSFLDGKPNKKEYRQFNIEGEGHPDDYAMMEEVIARRYQRLKNEKKKMPDLIVVDGGKGQVSSARGMLELLDLDIPLIGLAKKEEHIFIPGKKKPLVLDKRSHALKLLQHVRDESHRFSNTRLRRRYKNASLNTALQKINGIGPKRINILFKHFKSVKAVKAAPEETLANIEGIGEDLAKKIYDYFHPGKTE